MLQEITITYRSGVKSKAQVLYTTDAKRNALVLIQDQRKIMVGPEWRKIAYYHDSVIAEIKVFIGNWIAHNQFVPPGYNPLDFGVIMRDQKFGISPAAYHYKPDVVVKVLGESSMEDIANVKYFERKLGTDDRDRCDFDVTWTTPDQTTKNKGQHQYAVFSEQIYNAITSGFGVAIKPATI